MMMTLAGIGLEYDARTVIEVGELIAYAEESPWSYYAIHGDVYAVDPTQGKVREEGHLYDFLRHAANRETILVLEPLHND